MPEMDGFTVAQRILMEARFGEPRIALLTSAARRKEADAARALGLPVCLTKPVGERELLDAISRILEPEQRKTIQ